MRQAHYSLIFSTLLLLLFSWAAWLANSFNELARFFPFYIAVAGVVLTFLHVIVSTVALVKEKKPQESAEKEEEGSVIRYMAWIIGYIGIIYLIGFLSATTIFLLFFLYFESKFSLIKVIISVVITQVLIHIFANSINLYWPKGIFPLWPF